VAADHPLLVDSKLEDVVAVGLLALGHGPHPERQPLLLLGGRGLLACVRDGNGLLGVLGLSGHRVAVNVDLVAFVDDVRAVIVVARFGRIAAVAGTRAPAGPTPDGRGSGPPRGPPRARVPAPPVAVEAVVVVEVVADDVALIDEVIPVDRPGRGPIPRRPL